MPGVGSSFRNNNIRVGDPLGMNKKVVFLSADDTGIDTRGVTMIELQSNSATAANRTFTLASSNLVGHELFVYFTSGSSYTAQLANSGTCRLQNGAWEPAQYGSIKLVSDGTYWYEQTRGTATWQTSASVTLSEDDQAVATAATGNILITSDNATYTNRTFTLTASSVVGHMVTLIFISASNRCQLLEDSTTKLSDDWLPAQYDTLTLISDGTRWIEVARSYGNSATGVASVALAADDQAVATEGLKLIILTSDNATAANRTFVPTASPRIGHELTLLWNSTNEGQLADTATVCLTAAWEPTNLYQSIRLISDGTRWIEVCRADPT
jgi:hypothetical protein